MSLWLMFGILAVLAGSVMAMEEATDRAEPVVPPTAPPAGVPESVVPAQAAPVLSAPSTVPSVPAAAMPSGLKDYYAQQGLDVSRFPDDRAMANQLLDVARQFHQLQPELMTWQQQREAFQQWQAQQQQARQPVQPKTFLEQKPPFDPRWVNMVERDPLTGALRAKADAPPDVPAKLQAYAAWENEWQRKLLSDPTEALGPVIEQRVQQLFEKQFGQFQEQQTAKDLIAPLNDHLWQKDASGQLLRDRNGARVHTPFGRAYHQYTEHGWNLGIRNVQAQHEYALAMASAYLWQSGGQLAAQQQRFIQNGPGQRLGQQTPASPAPAGNGSLHESLKAALAGVDAMD